MSEEVSILDNNFNKAILILSYAVIEINICSIFISLIAIKCRSKNIKKLRNKFFGLIIVDSIIVLLSTNILSFFHSLIIELFSICFSLIEFYLLLSFIYQIINNTEISKLAKKVKLINPIYLIITYFIVNLPYHKYLDSKIISIFQNLVTLICLILFFRYLRNIFKTTSSNLLSIDFRTKKVYIYLNNLNLICLIFIVCYISTKFLSILMINNTYEVYCGIALTIFKVGTKYFALIILNVIIYSLNKTNFKNYIVDENMEIIQTKI